jgi:putative PIN family toxin of toxin-antitoxin system
MKVVLDTNVLISALFFGGKPRKLLEFWSNGKIQIVYSQEILDEYLAVLEEFRPWPPDSGVQQFLALLSLSGIPVNAVSIEENICRDSKDQMFLEAARSGKASHIVSGDKDLLVLKEYCNIKIATVRELLNSFT